jgi:drug/metabolite transporter (DMT)-like permease
VVIRLLEHADQWQANFYRSGSLAVFMMVYLSIRHRRRVFEVVASSGWKAVLGGFFVGIAMFCNIIAIAHTTVANATLMMAAGPIVAAVFGGIVLGEKVTSITWLAITIAAVGITIMVGGNPLDGGILGDLIALLGMMGFGCYVVVLRTGRDVDMTPAVFYAGLFSACAAAAVSLTLGNGLVVPLNDVLYCSFLGVVQLGIGSILFAIASSGIPAVELTLIALGEPVLAPIWVWLAVGEVPASSTFLGGAILVVAVFIHLFANKNNQSASNESIRKI